MTSNQSCKAYTDRNVYILGAGFSVEAGLPLIRDFMNCMRDADLWLAKGKERDAERQAIGRVLDFRLRAASAAYRVPLDVENIEDLFSLAAATGDRDLSDAMTTAIAATLDYARCNLPVWPKQRNVHEKSDCCVGLNKQRIAGWKMPDTWQPMRFPPNSTRIWYECPPHEFYLGILSGYFGDACETQERRDTFITFNYDTVAEDALNSLGIAYSYGTGHFSFADPDAEERHQRGQNLQILKLHGSVNWQRADLTYTGMKTAAPANNGPADGTAPSVRVFRDYAALHAAGGRSIVVPPTWQKGGGSVLTSVWENAVNALREATRIVIIGYSIPPTDVHFKYLIAAGLQDNISLRKLYVVNPAFKDDDKQLESRVLNVFRQEHLDQGVIDFVPATVREFFYLESMDKLNEIGRARTMYTTPDEKAHWWTCELINNYFSTFSL